MALDDEIRARREEIKTDGYGMSVGELASLYESGELDVHPEFQRNFRWTPAQCSRFVESILLGIPIPSIFLSQNEDATWEVVDGLQRIATLFQLMGILKDKSGQPIAPLALEETKYLPSLSGKRWKSANEEERLSKETQLLIKRARLDLKIVLRESTSGGKYELFRRLNTGGSLASDQEVRNCVLLMIDSSFFEWQTTLSEYPAFRTCTALSDRLMNERYDLELVTRFLVFRSMVKERFNRIRDLAEFLTDEMEANARGIDRQAETAAFRQTFDLLADALGDETFRRFDRNRDRFMGPFLISAFEAIALGVGFHADDPTRLLPKEKIVERVKDLWESPAFNSGGVAASSRIPVTIPLGRDWFTR
jgi:Protein of unknown function DUF262